ncbi:MAG TPA: hypothetical protein VGB00_00470 [Pyrinomonadaceae bacterium]
MKQIFTSKPNESDNVSEMEGKRLIEKIRLRNILSFGTKVEAVSKNTVIKSLKNATRRTQKGEYQKINHGGDLLGKIDAKKVRRSAHFCEILFDVLAKKIG